MSTDLVWLENYSSHVNERAESDLLSQSGRRGFGHDAGHDVEAEADGGATLGIVTDCPRHGGTQLHPPERTETYAAQESVHGGREDDS